MRAPREPLVARERSAVERDVWVVGALDCGERFRTVDEAMDREEVGDVARAVHSGRVRGSRAGDSVEDGGAFPETSTGVEWGRFDGWR